MKCQAIIKKGTSKERQCKNIINTGKYCRFHIPLDFTKEEENIHIYDKPSECPICLTSLFQVKTPLECGHWVHKSCLSKFFTVKFQDEMERFKRGYMPNIKTECPICKAEIADVVERPIIIVQISKDAIIEAIKNFLNGQGIERSLFYYLVSLNPIEEINLAVFYMEIACIITSMIISGLDEKTRAEFDSIFENTKEWPDIKKIYDFELPPAIAPVIYNIIKASDSAQLLLQYQL